MEKALSTLIVMEMLAVNLVTVDICSHRKYSRGRTFFTLLLFTLLLTAITGSWWEPLGFLQGNALFAVIGIIYLAPLFYLYSDPALRMSGILFSAWVYTLLVFCLSVRAAYVMAWGSFIGRLVLVQGVIYVITIVPFLSWIKTDFLFILRNIARKDLYLLQAVSLCWFGSIILINGNLIYPHIWLLQLGVVFAVGVDAVLSYWLIVSMFKSLGEVKHLQDIVYIDPLTGIYNRKKLFIDAESLVKKKKAFRLIFMDLNHFKSVNDQYGHQAGDRYLVAYANSTKEFLRNGENLYRISGDEFVIISRTHDRHVLMDRLHNYPKSLEDIEFLGCSVGFADYPQEETSLDSLIALADQRMYQDKHSV